MADLLDGGRTDCELTGSYGRIPGSVLTNLAYEHGSKHDLHHNEQTRSTTEMNLEAVRANGSGEVPLQQKLRTFLLINVWSQLLLSLAPNLRKSPFQSTEIKNVRLRVKPPIINRSLIFGMDKLS
jgi:hypothetical protein